MKDYIELQNQNVIKFREKLVLTKDIDDILFMEKPYKELVDLRTDKDFKLYQLLINKYDLITFEILNGFLHRRKTELVIEPITVRNNIINIAGIDINPVAQGFSASELSRNTAYPGGLKYFTVASNPYFNTLTDKEICIIKILGPWEINEKNELELFFHEEIFFKRKKNKVKTIFMYVAWGIEKSYTKTVYGENYDFIVVDNPEDNRIGEYIKQSDVFIIDKVSILNKYDCGDDSVVLAHTMFLVNQFLLSAKNNADLVFMYTTPHILPHYQLYYYLYRNFSTMIYFISVLSEFRDGIFIFKSLNNMSDNLLDNILKKYKKIDNTYGHNLYLVTDKTWCNQQKYEPPIRTDTMISSLYTEKFSDKFDNFMYKIKKHKKKRAKLNVQKIEFLKKQIHFKNDNTYNYNKIKSYVYFNIDECVQFLEKHDIEISDTYKQNVIFNSVKTLKSFFPNINDNVVKKLQFSRDSIYSISSYDIAEKTSMLIKTYFKSARNIIDGTANIGGNSFNFSKNFDKVISNELSRNTYQNLKNNINVLGLKNIQIYNDDIVSLLDNEKFFRDIKYDEKTWCLYLDPPWTGVYYKLEKIVDLYFGDINVSDFIKKVNVKYICMKVPKNFNLSYLFDLFSNIKIIKVVYCYIVLIEKQSK